METEIEAVTSNEDDVNKKLELAIQDNLELSHQIKSKADKLQDLESKCEADNETFSQLKEELEIKCLEVENLHKLLEECNVSLTYFYMTFLYAKF